MTEALDIARYTGIGQFGPAYRHMFEHDPHAAGSVDRILAERMIRLRSESAGYLYDRYTPLDIKCEHGSRPELERFARMVSATSGDVEETIEGIGAFTSCLEGKVIGEGPDEMLFGGTEEQVMRRGSDWCTDVARVGCVLCQIAGLPSRLVFLIDTGNAYSGHVIIETYRREGWGAIDTSTGVVYKDEDGRPASTWELMNQPELIESHRSHGERAVTSTPEQFRGAAISNYFVWESAAYDYAVSRLNDYTRSILAMANQGWPGDLRWLHGEELL